jgi:hypothetical protein
LAILTKEDSEGEWNNIEYYAMGKTNKISFFLLYKLVLKFKKVIQGEPSTMGGISFTIAINRLLL